jgi:hypothetical protein
MCGPPGPAPPPGAVSVCADTSRDLHLSQEEPVFKIWNAANFRRSVAGISLLLAPILFAAAEMAGPETSGDASAQLAAYAAHRGALLASALLGIGSFMLFLPALFGLLQQVRRRGVVYAHVAAVMVVYAAVALAALWGVNLMFWEMAKPGLDRTAMAALLDSLQHENVIGAPLLLGHYMLVFGFILLGVGLWRANVAPRWAAVLVILFPVTDVVVSFLPVDALFGDLISNAFGIVGFGALGLKLLASPDAAWDQAPDAPQPVAAQPVAA